MTPPKFYLTFFLFLLPIRWKSTFNCLIKLKPVLWGWRVVAVLIAVLNTSAQHSMPFSATVSAFMQQASMLSKLIVGKIESIWTMWRLEDPNVCKIGFSESKNLGWSAQRALDGFVRECVELQLQVNKLEERTFYGMIWKAFWSWRQHYYYLKEGKKEVYTFFTLKVMSVLCMNGDAGHVTMKKYSQQHFS